MKTQITKCMVGLFLLFFARECFAVAGKVYATDGPHILILRPSENSDRLIAVTNYNSDKATMGKYISIPAKRIGVYHYGDLPLELWEPNESAEQSENAAITNSIHQTASRSRVATTNRVVSSASTIPGDVAQADAKVRNLKARIAGFIGQSAALQQKQSERAVAHLGPDMATSMQFNQAQYQIRLLKGQLVDAERQDYLLRDYHHLPPMPK